MTDIPDAAIEAAAEAIRDSLDGDQQRASGFAHEVIEAAMPAIREAIAQELMSNSDTRKNEWEAIAVRSAARFVRDSP